MTFQLSVISLEKIEYRDKVDSVTCPGTEGELTVLKNHALFVTALKSGEITIKKGEAVAAKFPISEGVLEVKKDETVILITKA